MPKCYGLEESEDEFLMVFEDLDASGFALRKQAVSLADMQLCLDWLAHFHATFLGATPTGLWAVGCYWHLATRPDELEALGKLGALRRANRAVRDVDEAAPAIAASVAASSPMAKS